MTTIISAYAPPSFLTWFHSINNNMLYTMELKTFIKLKTTGLLQPWQTLCKIFSKCLTTRVTGWDQPPLQIMKMMYCFINNIHVDYADLLGKDDVCRGFGLDVSLTQSQPTESTQGTHRTPSAPRSPNPKMDTVELSAPKRSTVIRFRLPERRSTRLTPPAPVPTVDKADEMILQDTLQGHYTYLFEHLKARFLSRKSFDTLADHLQEVMIESSPTMVDTHIKEQVKKQVPEQVRDQVLVYVAEGLILERQKTKEEMEQIIAKAILQEAELSSGQVNENEQDPSTSGNQEQEDHYDFWNESYASDDDEIPTKQMTINEAKLKKMVDEMLRQRCTSVDEHQYHIDQMKNFLKSDIVWESRKEILVSPHPQKDHTSSSKLSKRS
ncbi:hypothetical protein Tco_0831322 [Tanacetum coccineum]